MTYKNILAYRIMYTWFFAVALVALIGLSSSAWESIGLEGDILFLAGAALVGVATVGRLWCLLYIAGYKTDTLITTGPYSMCRNPLYVFSLLGAIGVGMATETITIPTIILLAFATYYPFVLKGEEKELMEVHGEKFADYVNSTPSFFPRLSLLQEPDKYEVKPKIFRKNLFDALWFVWLMGILELAEAFHESGLLPVFFKLY
jgi:protein-S-isoprenylcysteine O-methyltransferase Ste14